MIDAYITYIRDIRRYSPRTQDIYRDVLEDFSRFAEGEVVASLTPSMLRRYEADCINRGMKPRTVHQHMSVLSGFCRFLMMKGVLNSNPARNVKRPKMEKRLPEYYQEKSMDAYFEATEHWAGEDELEILLSYGPAPKDKAAVEIYRHRLHRLIISLLFGIGIRRAELIGLKTNSFDPARQVMRVLGKGDKMREIPVVPSLCHEICLYLKAVESMRGGASPADGPLLVGPVSRLRGQDGQRGTRRVRHHREEIPPCAQAHGSHGPFRRRRRPELHQGDARTRVPRRHAGLHAQLRRPAEKSV